MCKPLLQQLLLSAYFLEINPGYAGPDKSPEEEPFGIGGAELLEAGCPSCQSKFLTTLNNEKESAFCGDADPCRHNKYCFTFSFDSTSCNWAEFFTGNCILWHPPHSGIILHPQARTITLTPTLDLLNPKSTDFQQTIKDYYCAKLRVILIRGFRFIMLTYTPTHIVTKWSQYPCCRITLSAWIIILLQSSQSINKLTVNAKP